MEIDNGHQPLLDGHRVGHDLDPAGSLAQRDGVVQVAERHGLNPEQHGPLGGVAREKNRAGAIALNGDGQERPVGRGRAVAGNQQRGANLVVQSHPAESRLDGQMQSAATAAAESEIERGFGAEFGAEPVSERDGLRALAREGAEVEDEVDLARLNAGQTKGFAGGFEGEVRGLPRAQTRTWEMPRFSTAICLARAVSGASASLTRSFSASRMAATLSSFSGST